MDPMVKVAVVRGDNRRGAVSQALALIADDLRRVVAPEVLVKPNLVSDRSQLPSTHADTLSVALDYLQAFGGKQIVVAEGASDATAGFARFGYHQEAWRRPVRFFDINRDETAWDTIELCSVDGEPLRARLSRTVSASPCRVSLALAKTHVTSMVTLSLKNMLSSLHPADRIMMHGHAGGGNGYQGWKRLVIEFLKGDSVAVNVLTRLLGRLRNARHVLNRRSEQDAFRSLKPKELAYLRSVEAMNHNLVALAHKTKPHLSVVDGFRAMHREGPRHGSPIDLRTVIAGTDAVAVDAVASAVMGFDPFQVGYLYYAHASGLGVADLDQIEVVGDPIEAVRRRFVPHSNHPIQSLWPRLASRSGPGPHAPLSQPAARSAHS